MLISYFSPLAPAVLLLAGAFLLPLVAYLLSLQGQQGERVTWTGAPAVVALAILALLGMRLTLGGDASGRGLELISGWNFSPVEAGASLAVRADELSLPFLILILMILLIGSLALRSFSQANGVSRRMGISSWLAVGAGTCGLFVAANGLTLGYAVLAVDALTALYWWRRGQADPGVARLFLGVVTAAGLVLANLVPGAGFLLSLALWLRLGLYPFLETGVYARRPDASFPIYMSLSLAVGVYLVLRVPVETIPVLVWWLAALLMLVNGLLTWLANPLRADNAEVHRLTLLTRLLLAEILLVLLALPLPREVIIFYSLGLILSLVALWVTPRLGPPGLAERNWIWSYLPAAAATLTLIGLPFSLGWSSRTAIYGSFLAAHPIGPVLLLLLADGLALSGLVHYWLALWQGQERDERRSGVGIVAMVPFLTPGLAPFILGTIILTPLPAARFTQPAGVWLALAGVLGLALALGYFRDRLVGQFNRPVQFLGLLGDLQWLVGWGESLFNGLGKASLRVRVVMEGQHYLGWALFVALVGALIILLR